MIFTLKINVYYQALILVITAVISQVYALISEITDTVSVFIRQFISCNIEHISCIWLKHDLAISANSRIGFKCQQFIGETDVVITHLIKVDERIRVMTNSYIVLCLNKPHGLSFRISTVAKVDSTI